ncbi:YonK family protein [Siminovitchia sp. 179-K 8D1 HS]|uniref:YonK family protein n=1 Tax=Siminovitchia sp. 179-K 8D1 HS TaxID=3142385 RepID=UPI0039A10059
MAKRKNQTSGKGYLELNFDEGYGRITTVTKDEEFVYDFFKILKDYDGKHISFSLSEELELPTVDEE